MPAAPPVCSEVPRPNLDGSNSSRVPSIAVSASGGILSPRRPPDSRRFSRPWPEIANQPSVDELIVSGGDPLTLPDAELSSLMASAAGIGHLRRVRIHSRACRSWSLNGSRTDLILLMRSYRMPPIMVIHVNHPA